MIKFFRRYTIREVSRILSDLQKKQTGATLVNPNTKKKKSKENVIVEEEETEGSPTKADEPTTSEAAVNYNHNNPETAEDAEKSADANSNPTLENPNTSVEEIPHTPAAS